jgi:Cullin binding
MLSLTVLVCKVLEFSTGVDEDLSNYDLNSAWPSLVDEFVLHVRCKHAPATVSQHGLNLSPSSLAQAGLLPDRVKPTAGSKRKLLRTSAEELTEQLSSARMLEPDEPLRQRCRPGSESMLSHDHGALDAVCSSVDVIVCASAVYERYAACSVGERGGL